MRQQPGLHGQRMRQQPGPHAERADVQAAAGGQFVQHILTGEHPGTVQRQHRVQRTGRCVHRQRGERFTAEHTGPQQRVQVGAVIGVPVGDEYRIEAIGGDVFKQSRHDRIAKVEQQPESVMFHQVAAARLARFRIGTTAAEHGEPHPTDLPGRLTRGREHPVRARLAEDRSARKGLVNRRRTWSAVSGPDVGVQPPVQRCRGAQHSFHLVPGLAGMQPRRHRPLPPADQALAPEQFKPGMILGIPARRGLERLAASDLETGRAQPLHLGGELGTPRLTPEQVNSMLQCEEPSQVR